jgi:hypothetical protein
VTTEKDVCTVEVCEGCEHMEYMGVIEHEPDHGEWSPCWCGCAIYDGARCEREMPCERHAQVPA